jgi:primase-polymerase (primpol)-like protein
VDLDDCVSKESISEPAVEVIQKLQSYIEIPTSGHGLRILVASPDYQENYKTKSVEVYSHSRYVTLTGNHLDGTPLKITNVDPSTLQSLRPPEQPPHTTSTINTPSGTDKLPGRSDLT